MSRYYRFPGGGNSTVTGAVSITGSVQVSGLTIAGLVSSVVINDVTWTAVPATPLANRNALCIFNTSVVEIKLNYSSGVAGYFGVPLAAGNQRFYDITDSIIMYAKSSSGSPTIIVEELS